MKKFIEQLFCKHSYRGSFTYKGAMEVCSKCRKVNIYEKRK